MLLLLRITHSNKWQSKFACCNLSRVTTAAAVCSEFWCKKIKQANKQMSSLYLPFCQTNQELSHSLRFSNSQVNCANPSRISLEALIKCLPCCYFLLRTGFSGHQDEEVAEEPDDTLHRHCAQPSRLHHRWLQWRRPSHHHRFGTSYPTSLTHRQWPVHLYQYQLAYHIYAHAQF